MSSRWMPDREKNIVAMCKKWGLMMTNEVTIAAYRWMEELLQPVLDKMCAFVKAVEAFEENDNSTNRNIKNTTKREAVKAMQDFASSSVRNNPFMTDANKREMGLHIADGIRTPHPCPMEMPRVVVKTTAFHFQHRLLAHNEDTDKATKPAGVHGVRFAWQVGGERPATGEELIHGRFCRKAEHVVVFTERERAKTVYYAACYENAKGEAGPWSSVVEAIIG